MAETSDGAVNHPERPLGSLELGTLLDSRYRIASVAARSANDVVFNALDERSRQRVRLRVTAHELVPELALLRHEAIPAVLREGAVRSAEGRWSYAVLEWFDGAPLTLPVTPASDEASVRAWATSLLDLLDVVGHVHGGGRAHGDLGLHSLWEGNDGRLRLIDVSAPDGVLSPEAIPYASPERLRGTPRDARSDVYSIGAVGYALATGAPPYGSEPLKARTGHLLWRMPEPSSLPPVFAAVTRR